MSFQPVNTSVTETPEPLRLVSGRAVIAAPVLDLQNTVSYYYYY